jgi:hypothetical protein
LPISGLDHLGHVFNQRIYTKAEDFNAVLVQISDPRFPNRGCAFFPYALTAEDEAKMVVEAPVAAVIEANAPAVPVARPEHPTFTLDDKAILLDGVRVAGLFGEDKQLRVLAAHADLRPAIEAWLQSQLQPA